jgi:hypothetical protein
MKPFLPPHSSTKRARPALAPTSRSQPSTMRSTVLQSLLLCPDGGAEAHRRGQGKSGTRPN